MDSDDTRYAYNSVPYTSYPFAFCQPERMEAVARLFGTEPPRSQVARVLELGCAGGGNIIPLAVRFPGSTFTGFDIAEKQIEAGQALASRLGLKNLNLRADDFSTLEKSGEQFDYIICHGVLSWVPQPVQALAIRVVAKCLAPNGVAVFTFNALPGALLRDIARHACMSLLGEGDDYRTAAMASVQKFQMLANSMTGKDQYSAVMRNEAELMRGGDFSYVASEYLTKYSEPLSFRTFCKLTADEGLSYFADAELNETLAAYYCSPPQRAMLNALSTDPVTQHSLIDVVTGRSFRKVLVVRSENPSTAAGTPILEAIDGFHFTSNYQFSKKSGASGAQFVTRNNSVLAPQDRVSAETMTRIAKASPSSCSFEELAGDTAQGDARIHLRKLLIDLWGRRHIDVSALPLRVENRGASSPRTSRLVCAQIESGSDWVTGLHHTPIRLDALYKVILSLFDGKSTIDRVVLKLEQMRDQGALPPQGLNGLSSRAELTGLLQNVVSVAIDSKLFEEL